MSTDDPSLIVKQLQRLNRAFDRGLITNAEFIQNLLDEFAATNTTSSEIIPDICGLIPPAIRIEFCAALTNAVEPGFTWRAFHGVPMTAEEERAAEIRHAANISDWSDMILNYISQSLPHFAQP